MLMSFLDSRHARLTSVRSVEDSIRTLQFRVHSQELGPGHWSTSSGHHCRRPSQDATVEAVEALESVNLARLLEIRKLEMEKAA